MSASLGAAVCAWIERLVGVAAMAVTIHVSGSDPEMPDAGTHTLVDVLRDDLHVTGPKSRGLGRVMQMLQDGLPRT